VDVRVLTASGVPTEATFMLDSGLTTNLVTPELAERLDLPIASETVTGTALGGVTSGLSMALIPGLELAGDILENETRYGGVWEQGNGGWRAWCSFDWDGWLAAAQIGGRLERGRVQYSVLPSANMTPDALAALVGRSGIEFVTGDFDSKASTFVGKGVSVEPKGFLAPTERYEIRREGEDLVDVPSGMRLQRTAARSYIPLPGPLLATNVPFAQSELAKRQGIELTGMLGQLPLHLNYAVQIDPLRRSLSLYPAESASEVAAAAGLRRLAGSDLNSGLFGVQIMHAPVLQGPSKASMSSVPAVVDSGSANTILNWPAAELLLGLRKDDRIVSDAPRIRAVGVGGGQVEMPLLTLSIGLLGGEVGDENSLVHPKPVRVAIGDVSIFSDIVGREDKGSWPFGLGPRSLKPAALIGQDILSQQQYILSASEPALYITPDSSLPRRHLEFIGQGDCLDQEGRRLRGLQKLACTPDDAAQTCLELPAGACQGVAVTPLQSKRFQGLCYIFVADEEVKTLEDRGWKAYGAPEGQELAPQGTSVASANGDPDAECYSWRDR